MAGEGGHALPVDSAGLVKGNRQRLGGGLDMLLRLVALQRAPLEDGGPGRALMLGVVVFEREEEGLIGVSGERPQVLARGKRAVAVSEGVVEAAQQLPRLDDALFGRVFELGLKDQAHSVADRHHPAHAGGRVGREGRRLEAVAVAHDKCAVAAGRKRRP